jgi:hypothetical protein
MRYQLANLDDDMTNCPTQAQYALREEVEAQAKANGHNLYPYWKNNLGQLERPCLNCKHVAFIMSRNGVAGVGGRATTHRCGEAITYTHEVRYTYINREGLPILRDRQFENLDIALAFTRTLHAGSFTVWTVDGEEVTL